MLRLVRRLVVDVDVRPFHIRQALQLRLEFLGHIVRRTKGLGRVHDDVDLDNDAGSAVIRPHGVDGDDHRRMRHR